MLAYTMSFPLRVAAWPHRIYTSVLHRVSQHRKIKIYDCVLGCCHLNLTPISVKSGCALSSGKSLLIAPFSTAKLPPNN